MKIIIASITLVSLSALASTDEKFIPGDENSIHQKGVMTMTIPWIKDKGDKYDVRVRLHNDNENKGMIIFLSDLSCQRGKITGPLKHTFFNTGERTIDFKPNQTKEFTLVCKTEGAQRGDFKLKIGRVYNNPSLDGKTVGKVIAKDLSWSQSDRRN